MKIINLGLQDYIQTWDAMKAFTQARDIDTEDELWVVEHPSVFTQGISGKDEHILTNSEIPIYLQNQMQNILQMRIPSPDHPQANT